MKPWLEILQQLLVTEDVGIQHRACHLTVNLMSASKDIATKLVESQVGKMLCFCFHLHLCVL